MPDEKKEPAKAPSEPSEEVVKHDLPKKPVIGPDGHVHLSQKDIDNRA